MNLQYKQSSSDFPTRVHQLRGGMVGTGMIFDETYRPFFEAARQHGVYDRRFGICDVQLAAVASRTGKRAEAYRDAAGEKIGSFESFIEPDSIFLRRFHDTIEAIGALPRDAGSYGSIHTDLHSHNIFWLNGEPRVFDFDDMLEFWFVADLAIVLYYGLLGDYDDLQAEFERMRDLLLRGYATEHALPQWSHDALRHFLSLREQTLRAAGDSMPSATGFAGL